MGGRAVQHLRERDPARSSDPTACDVCGRSGSVARGTARRYLAVLAGGAVERRTACDRCEERAAAQGWVPESPKLTEWSGELDRSAPPRGGNGHRGDGNGHRGAAVADEGAGVAVSERAAGRDALRACDVCGRERLTDPYLAVVDHGARVEARRVCGDCIERARERGWMPESPQLASLSAELGVLAPPAPPARPLVRPPARVRSRVLRGGARFLSAVLVTTGILGLSDVGITLLWQEPITSLRASIEQGRLDDELAEIELAASSPVNREELGTPVAEVAAKVRDRLEAGDAVGRLSIPAIGIDFVMVEDAGEDSSLARGPARYTSTYLPGEGATMGVAGHRTTYSAPFNDIDALDKGDEINVSMPYGEFTYAVQETEIVSPENVDVLDNGRREKLVMTACHPLYSAAQRIVVTAVLEDAESDRPGVRI